MCCSSKRASIRSQRYNDERPHQALDMHTPATHYTPSPRLYGGLEALEYPGQDWTAVITACGRICYQGRKINVSQVFGGQKVGVKQVDDHIWLVTFMHYDLGDFDDETCSSNRSIIPSVRNGDPCLRNRLLPMSPE